MAIILICDFIDSFLSLFSKLPAQPILRFARLLDFRASASQTQDVIHRVSIQTQLSFLFCQFAPINPPRKAISLCFPTSALACVPRVLTPATVIPSHIQRPEGVKRHKREGERRFLKVYHD